MTNIRRIDPFRVRTTKNAKDMIEHTLQAIEGTHGKVSGFVVMAWDDTGATTASVKDGGIVSCNALPVHVLTQLQRFVGS